MLYELYIGHPPFVSESLQELVDMVTNAPVPLPAPESELGMSRDFESLLLALLEKDPEYRMSWRQLLVHPFWSTAPPPAIMPLPAQPQFAAFLQRRPRCVCCRPLLVRAAAARDVTVTCARSLAAGLPRAVQTLRTQVTGGRPPRPLTIAAHPSGPAAALGPGLGLGPAPGQGAAAAWRWTRCA